MFILSYKYERKLPLRSPALQNSDPDMSKQQPSDADAPFSSSTSAQHGYHCEEGDIRPSIDKIVEGKSEATGDEEHVRSCEQTRCSLKCKGESVPGLSS